LGRAQLSLDHAKRLLGSALVNRKRLVVLLSSMALSALLSCTSGELPLATQLDGDTTVVATPPEQGPTQPVDTAPPAPVDTTPAPVDSSGPLLNSTLLTCRPQAYAVTTAVIGPKGGLIMFGNHALKIYEGALTENVTITAEQVEGTVNSVRFSPEGLKFAVPAVLSLSYKNCDNVRHWKSIVYTDESLKILEPTLSYDFSNSSQVRGLIYHFSRYAVAY
jgi:hypothetical protein